jgi:hypothetical protein
VAKKSTATQQWTCPGLPGEPHIPINNVGPDCTHCGAKKEVILGKSKPPGKKFPIIPIAVGSAIGLLVLGAGWLASPHLGGLCEITNNCAAWEDDLSKANSLLQKGKQAVDQKEPKLDALKQARQDVSTGITLLTKLKQNSGLQAKAIGLLKEGETLQKKLDQKIVSLQGITKPTPSPTPSPTLNPTPSSTSSPTPSGPVDPAGTTGLGSGTTGGSGSSDRTLEEPPVSDPSPEPPIATRPAEPYYPPPVAPAPEPPARTVDPEPAPYSGGGDREIPLIPR